MMMKSITILFVAALALASASPPDHSGHPTIVDLVSADPDFSMLVTALKAAGLVDTLAGTGPFTVAAPTNAAFKALPSGKLADLLKPENKKKLVDLLEYHVFSGVVRSKDIKDKEIFKTLEGKIVQVTTDVTGKVKKVNINNAEVVKEDLVASNGVVQVINKVLMPAEAPQTIVDLASADPDLSMLVTALKAAGLADTLASTGPFTVAAPTNEAFKALGKAEFADLLKPENKKKLVDLLEYHVFSGDVRSKDIKDKEFFATLSQGHAAQGSADASFPEPKYVQVNVDGKKVYINKAEVVSEDIVAANGVVYIINAVLMTADAPVPTIMDLASSNPELSTLVTALKAAGLYDEFASTGSYPVTLAAPTNAAFKALPSGKLDDLLKPENKKELVDLLTYHVSRAVVYQSAFVGYKTAYYKTLEGKSVEVTQDGEKIYINKAEVISGNIHASNGVVQVINAVLSKADAPLMIVDILSADPELSNFVTALNFVDLAQTLEDMGPFERGLTVAAPTNAAFKKYAGKGTFADLLTNANYDELKDMLRYHMFSGVVRSKDIKDQEIFKTLEGKIVQVTVDDTDYGMHTVKKVYINRRSEVVKEDVAANGVVQVINRVLIPAFAPKTIVDLASANPKLSMLVTALKKADLADTLATTGPFTVAAPTNAAFKALGKGKFADLLKPENKTELVDLLKYHVFSGVVRSKDIKGNELLKTLEGKFVGLTVDVTGAVKKVYINNAEVVSEDIVAANGVMYIINNVLSPATAPTAPSSSDSFLTVAHVLEIVAGIAGAAILVAAAYFCYQRSQKQNNPALHSENLLP